MSGIRIFTWLAIVFAVLIPLFLFYNLSERRGLIRNTGESDLDIEIMAKNLNVPWSMDFLPDGRMIFTERAGKVRILDINTKEIKDVGEITVAQISESGLLGIAVDPDFIENDHVYLYYTYDDNDGMKNKISRFTLENDKIKNENVIIDNIPGAEVHDGGRIKFGPDGKLYITTGDATNTALSQDRNSLAGKILRLNKNGSIPEDNPFNNAVYSYGHRNPQGLAWHPVTNNLYETEHGPSMNDEMNFIEAGKNYGWPAICSETAEDIEQPLLCFKDETIAPSGAAFFEGEGEWKNNLFFTALKGTHLHRVTFTGSKNIDRDEKLLSGYGRLRDVVYHDGYLYIATNNKDGRGFPLGDDDKILRIKPI